MSNANTIAKVQQTLARRHRAEKRFRAYGIASIVFGLLCLVVLFTDIIGKGYSAFLETRIQLSLNLDTSVLELDNARDREQLQNANFEAVVRESIRKRFPDVTDRGARRQLSAMISGDAAYQLRDYLADNPQTLSTTITLWVLADDDVDTYIKSRGNTGDAVAGLLQADQVAWVESLRESGDLRRQFNTTFFTSSDSREPEQSGILGAALGSLFTLIVCLLLSFPIGVAAAIYLEEYAQKNRLTDLIEVNINNLAAVPSIIFGLLGLAIFINMFGLPRSVPLVGGLVLTLMTLPTIIIASRSAIKAVPPSIREAALGIGASKMQMIIHHVLPLALPGMLTGTIIGMARALGETAPLLMIGMVAFIVDLPSGPTDPATVLPVQIFLWADSPERAFVERTSAAIMVLLTFLFLMNGLAVWLRKRLERRW
jgi:phosphate transport system permease protein